MSTTPETIKPLPGHGGYHASTRGTIFYERGKSTLKAMRPWRIDGTPMVKVKIDGPTHRYSVAALVLMAHVGPRPTPRHIAVHRDGNADDNRIENLKWGLREEFYAIRAALRAPKVRTPRTRRRARAPRPPVMPTPDYRPIPGFSGYFVNAQGEVISMNSGTRRTLMTSRHAANFMQVQMRQDKDKTYRPVSIGIIVLTTFVRARGHREIVGYVDGDHTNYSVGNLYWTTRTAKRATEATQDAVCDTLGTAGGDHPANGHRRACGPAEGVGVDFLRDPLPPLTGPPPFSRAREIEHGGMQP